MARFTYYARDGRGEPTSGTLQAVSIDEAGRMLRGEGKFVIKLMPVSDNATGSERAATGKTRGRVKRQEVIIFAHQMAVMVQTGVPLADALDCSVQQASSPAFKAVLMDVAQSVQGGGEFSAALRKYPKVFPTVMTSLLRASEVSGTMGAMLDRISAYMTKEHATAKNVRGAMMYPLFMILMAVSVTVFLLTFVLPKFATIYETRGAVLPAPTRLLMAISHFMVDYWLYLLVGLVVACVGGTIFRRTPAGRRTVDYFKLHLPILKTLFTQLYVSRACSTMGTMSAAGVSMLDMVAIVKEVTNNAYYDELWDSVDEQLRQGSQLSDALFASPLFPRSVSQMIFSGEKSGRLGQVLGRVAEFTEEEFDRAVKTATQFIEPLMIGVMGSIIGFVAISLLLPIFSIGHVVAGSK